METPSYLNVMRHLGLVPDDWQISVLESTARRLLLNCSRQAGKTTVVAVLALVETLFKPMTRVLIVSRSHRQAKEVFRQIRFFHLIFREKMLARHTADEMEFTNMSRIVCVPCKEETIRGYAAIDLLIIDEAARVPDTLYRAVRPMLAVSKGRLICLSTPYGKRGFFWDAWSRGGDDWQRIEIPATKIPRISAEFLAAERRALGESWYRQEYLCSFESVEGLVYPAFGRCVIESLPSEIAGEDAGWVFYPSARPDPYAPRKVSRRCRRVGGIDFGFRNPFAAIWGLLAPDSTLYLTGEHYQSSRPLSDHARQVPKDVEWYCDPAGANEQAELRRADFHIRPGVNALREGIALVTARLEDGSLKVLKGRCPNLLREADLYRYETAAFERKSEIPLDANNHALAALRYLISKIDAGRLGRIMGRVLDEVDVTRRNDLDDERIWTPRAG